MEFLVKIIPIAIDQYRISSRAFLPKDSKLKQLFDTVASGKISTDTEAAILLYKSGPQEKRFLMLKKELKGKIMNRLLETTPKGTGPNTDLIEVKLQCRKQIIIAEILLAHALTGQAERILQRVDKQATEYALAPIQKTCLRLLRQIAIQSGNLKRIEDCNKKLNAISILENRIDEAEGMCAILKTKDSLTIAALPAIATQAKQDAKTLEAWLQETSHPVLLLYYYRLQALAAWHGQDLNLLRKVVEKWYQLLSKHPFLRNPTHLAEINLVYWRYCISTREMEKAWQLIERSLRYIQLTIANKFALHEAGFGTLLRMQRHEAAGKMLLKAMGHPQFPNLHAYEKSRWLLNQAYLYYISLCQQRLEQIQLFTPDFDGMRDKIEGGG